MLHASFPAGNNTRHNDLYEGFTTSLQTINFSVILTGQIGMEKTEAGK